MASDIYASARTLAHPAGTVVPGIYISLHDDSSVFLAGGVTGVDGKIFLGNRAAGTYELHITPPSPAYVAGNSLMTIVVDDSGTDFVFDTLITDGALPPAQNEHMCRCSGKFVDPYGLPASGVTLRFDEACEGIPNLLLSVDGVPQGVLPRGIPVETDSEGWASIDLIRGARYSVVAAGYQTTALLVYVPDLPSAHLPDVVFPIVDYVEYSSDALGILPVDTPAVVLDVGDVLVLDAAAVLRSSVRLGLTGIGFTLDGDSAAASVGFSGDDTITITALAAGSFTLAPVVQGTPLVARLSAAVRGVLRVTVN